jgi:hypothetical protein
MNYIPTKEELDENGVLIDTKYEGTCQLWSMGHDYWVVLSDNTVISLDEDNKENPIFPKKLYLVDSE